MSDLPPVLSYLQLGKPSKPDVTSEEAPNPPKRQPAKSNGYNYFRRNGNVKPTITLKGEVLTSPIWKHEECGHNANLNRIIDNEGGVDFAKRMVAMDKHGGLVKCWNKVMKKQGKLDEYTFKVEKEKLLAQFQEVAVEGGSSSYQRTINATCPECHLPIGKIKIELEVTEQLEEAKERTWNEIWQSAKKIPKKVGAKLAFELGHGSWENLVKWVENPDIAEAEKLTKEFSVKLNSLAVPDHVAYDFSKALNIFQSDLPKEARRRKQLVIEKIWEFARQEAIRR
jgi:hypothetical protein